MCRQIITHFMHHDVAAPMVLDSVASNPIVYANPLRTNFHQCELTFPPLGWLLNAPIKKCPYHSCCTPHVKVESCDDATAHPANKEGEERKLEPEDCEAFIIEHHHERRPYFGQKDSYWKKVPATWRDLKTLPRKNPDWFFGFAHDPRFRADWEEKCFAACEKLYTLEQDLAILHNTMRDLMASKDCAPSWLKVVRDSILKVEGEVHEQRKLVFGVFEWASEPCYSCLVKQ